MPSRDRLKHAQALIVWASRMLHEANTLLAQELPGGHPSVRFAENATGNVRVLEVSVDQTIERMRHG